MANKFDYQNMLTKINSHKITKNKNLSVNFTEQERTAWNAAIELCHGIVKMRRGKFEQTAEPALNICDVSERALKWWHNLSDGNRRNYEIKTFGYGDESEDNTLTNSDIEKIYNMHVL